MAVAGLIPHKPKLPDGEPIVTLTLVAAPDGPATKSVAVAPVPPVIQQPEKPTPPVTATSIKQPETPTPPERDSLVESKIPITKENTPVQPVAEPKPIQRVVGPVALASSPQNEFRGDGSSPKPGLDATTIQTPLGIKARPDYRKNPEPPSPQTARRRRQEGLVLLGVKVTAQGIATRIEVKQSSGYPLLDEAALQAVRGWEFEPARVGSLAVDSEIEVTIRFKLTD